MIIGKIFAKMAHAAGKIRSIVLNICYGFNNSTTIGKGVRVVNPQYIETGRRVHLDDGCELCVLKTIPGITPHLKLGNNVLIGKGCRLGCDNSITIENDVLLAPNVHITDRNHGYEDISKPIRLQPVVSDGPVIIGAESWLGFGCQIMSGVKIGRHCVVAAGAIVTRDVPDYCIVGGIPAKIIKQYDFDKKAWVKPSR